MKISSNWTKLIFAFAVCIISNALLFYFVPEKSTEIFGLIIKIPSALPKQKQVNIGLPVRLKIPKIKVNSAVEYVGLSSNRVMDVPKSRDNAGWFELGQRPGDIGSAVIAGHYGWGGGKGSVFDNLHKLRQGDKLYIEDDKGEIISFVVSGSRRYDPKDNASDVFGSNDGKAHLNLVTCEGVWDKKTKQYSKRLVVFADKE